MPTAPFLAEITRRDTATPLPERFPFDLPWLAGLPLRFDHPVTFLIGENGMGKSTLIEAIADLCGLPVSGGSRNEAAARHGPELESPLVPALRPRFRARPRDGYFFRAEFLPHFASLLDERRQDPDFIGDPYAAYGGRSLHARSHGEAFLALMNHRLRSGLILMDEPESALSPTRQLTLLALLADRVEGGNTQFIIATHSPIIMTFPGAHIVSLDSDGLERVALEETSHFVLTRDILASPATFWKHLSS